jgi:uncharacterized protein YbjT (DUF2867 family)
VIGATGLVGHAPVPVLARRREVLAISRRGSAPDVPGMRPLAADVTGPQRAALDDTIRYLDGVAGSTEVLGESFDVGGPAVLTYGDMVKRIARIRGRRPLILEVSLLTPAVVLILAAPRHARPRERRPSADRGSAQPDRGAR